MRFPKLNFRLPGGSYLRVTLLAGLMLLVLTGGVVTVYSILNRSQTKSTRQKDNFSRIMREYDVSARISIGNEKEFERLGRELDRLEKRAIGVESWLSVLKRRRTLARLYPPSAGNYRNSIKKALKAYPSSQPLAAFAAAAIVKDTALNREARSSLRALLPLLTESAFNPIRLGLHVLLGDFRSPERAMLLPDDLAPDGNEDITLDLAILKIRRADLRGAAADVHALLNSPEPSQNAIRFAAEYFYDFGDLRRSAQLFSMLDDEAAMIRQADALYLSGYTGTARSIWTILSDNPNENSLYNLAVTANDPQQAISFLEKLVYIEPVSGRKSRQFGLIRYSRLHDYPLAIPILEGAQELKPANFPYIDLEICRRNAPRQESGRQVADAWLLLDRHPEYEDLYQWAVWLMFFQRYYNEAKILLKRIERFHFAGQWVPVYNALLLMQEGDIETAEEILRLIPEEEAGWPVSANLGRILEARLSPAPALEQYETAVAKLQNPKTASRVQLRAARCLFAIGRKNDARRALEYALELDPDNITVRLELDRTLAP